MALTTGLDILAAARRGGYGVGSFNTSNMEITEAILAAAEAERSPVIVALSEGSITYAGRDLVNLVLDLGERASVPVAVHLDHGSSYESCLQALRWGLTSVMIDKSGEDEETNIRETARVVEAAHAMGVTVEAEIGRLSGIEDHVNVSVEDAALTQPEEAGRFMEQSGADYLAVAIGTSHGAFKGKGRPFIDHERLAGIAELVEQPLVLHGASGVPPALVERFTASGGSMADAVGIHEEDVQKAIGAGIAKINTDTDLRIAFTTGIREMFRDEPAEFDPRKYLGRARSSVQEVVAARMQLFGSSGQA
ncbi:MAG TPA: class II fructose-1,6-bisphosphate aldolase [Deinococcales bacterium]|nr:class II fructose-1,6-bisphosphate aldolase [Deinococcales bacterium]